jgi:ATP-dependent DNA helicase DinG
MTIEPMTIEEEVTELSKPPLNFYFDDQDWIRGVFGPEGIFSKAFNGYNVRLPQVKMTQHISRGWEKGDHCIVEAPTGTGKSVSYLVPAIRAAYHKGCRVLVCTGNKSLQDQLVNKDLPALQKLLPWPFEFSIAKGLSNYFCHAAYDENLEEIKERWVHDWTRNTRLGEVQELNDLARARSQEDRYSRVRRLVTISSSECDGNTCHWYDDCFAHNARKKWEKSQVIVSNYHLLFAHLAVKQVTDGAVSILPEFDYVVWDEAHVAPDIAREFFGVNISYRGVRQIIRKMQRLGLLRQSAHLERAAESFFGWCYDQEPESRPFLKEPLKERHWKPFHDQLKTASISALPSKYTKEEYASLDDESKKKAKARERAARQIENFADKLEAFATLREQDNVYYFERKYNDRFKKPFWIDLKSKLIDVGGVLNHVLWKTVKGSLQTSATLSVGSNLLYQARESGIDDIRFSPLIVDTPFDYQKNAALIVPGSHFPECRSTPPGERERWEQRTSMMLAKAVEQAGGRTLGLFTSHKMLQTCAEFLHEYIQAKQLNIRLLVQRDSDSRTALVQQFRADERAVLLGTESFWAGLDVQGPSLSVLFIDKIPFPHPGDPLMAALEMKVGRKNSFMQVSIPRAVMMFKQGVGRLIRSTTDKGVIIVADRRLTDKSYGRRMFINSGPKMPVLRQDVLTDAVCERYIEGWKKGG